MKFLQCIFEWCTKDIWRFLFALAALLTVFVLISAVESVRLFMTGLTEVLLAGGIYYMVSNGCLDEYWVFIPVIFTVLAFALYASYGQDAYFSIFGNLLDGLFAFACGITVAAFSFLLLLGPALLALDARDRS